MDGVDVEKNCCYKQQNCPKPHPIAFITCCMRPAPLITPGILVQPLYMLSRPCHPGTSCCSAVLRTPVIILWLILWPLFLILVLPFGLFFDAIICLSWIISCGFCGQCCPWMEGKQGCWMMMSSEREYRPCSCQGFWIILCGKNTTVE